jgi:hypothetical protein
MLRKIFQDHPESVGETYGEHFHSAFGFGTAMIVAGVKCLIHGFLPPVFTTSGSDAVRRLYDTMVAHRHRGHRQG